MITDLLKKIETELVPLDEICVPFFNNKPVVARRKAALNQLPVPAFRLGDARRGPLYVRKSDLEALAERRYKEAHSAHSKMVEAGAV